MLSRPGPQSSTSSLPSLLTHSTFDHHGHLQRVVKSARQQFQSMATDNDSGKDANDENHIFYRVCFSQWLNFAGIAALALCYWGKSNTEKLRPHSPGCACWWTIMGKKTIEWGWIFFWIFQNFWDFSGLWWIYFSGFFLEKNFWSFWHQQIYDTALGSRDIAQWRF